MRWSVIGLAWLLLSSAHAADYYVDPESRGGPCDDAGPGTEAAPWRTLARATRPQGPRARPGDTIWVRGGVYRETLTLRIGGAPGQPLTIRAFRGEKPVLSVDDQRQSGIILPADGGADYVAIEGLSVAGPAAGGTGICVQQRTGVTLRRVDVTGTRLGVLLSGCTEGRLLESSIHDCLEGNVLVDTGCAGITIADNHIHHNREGHGLSVYSPGDGVRGEGAVVAVEPAGPGLARFVTRDLDLSKVRDGTLRGQDTAGTVGQPSVVLFFAGGDPSPDGVPLPGGSTRLQDGRDWFVLRSNPDWGGKPYSPDGRTGLFELGKADVAALARAKYVYTAYLFAPEVANRDIQILRNEVDHSTVQGIWVQRAEGVLIQGNRTHHNGATGIQIESLCRRVWLDANASYANSISYSHETGIWLDETIDAVVQNNTVYENQKGIGVTQCEWVLVRRNVIYNNQAQHATQNAEGGRANAGGFWYSGGRHAHLGAPPGAQHNAFVHNTLYGNGTPVSAWGGIQHGLPGYPRVGCNRVLNNLVQNALGAYVLYAGCTPVVLDGNLYHATAPVRALWKQGDRDTSYTLSEPQGLADYQRDTGQELHSGVTEVTFVDPAGPDFRLAPGAPATDRAQPLTRTTAGGTGTRVLVENVDCFSAGLRTRNGDVVIPGDEIMIGGSRARIRALDHNASALILEYASHWDAGAAVTYPYAGSGPDVGAFETE